MTKVSHIVSSDLLDLIDGRDFYMCLANIASKDKHYSDFYKEQVKKGAFVLLDNGAAESDQMTLDVMWKVIEEINPTEVILSDALLDGEETIRRSKEALDFYEEKGFKGQYMFVPQGKNIREWIRCFEDMDKTKISTIGVSKFCTDAWKDSLARVKCCLYIDEKAPVHLLGCHERIGEVGYIANGFNNIRSNDTAIAYIYAQANQDITVGTRPEGEINFIKSDLTSEQVELLKSNMEKFDRMLDPREEIEVEENVEDQLPDTFENKNEE